MPDGQVDIRPVRSPDDARDVAALVWEFFDFLKTRFPDQRQAIDDYLSSQDVAGELDDLVARFSPPAGECLIARIGDLPVGTLMMKRNDERICEMNRMFVRDAARGRGVARALCLRLMDRAREMGFREMRLEALNEEIPALPLYRSLGFTTDPDPSDYARRTPSVVALRRTL